MKDIPDHSVDMILCDLPYGTTQCKWDSVIPFEPLWEQYRRVVKENGAIVLFCAQPFTVVLGASNIELLRYSWVWEKQRGTGHLNARKRPMCSHEDILVFYQSQPTYNPQGVVYGSFKNNRPVKTRNCEEVYGKEKPIEDATVGNYPKTVLKFDKDIKNNRFHPTQKPVALLEYLIRTYTNEGETVLDNCMGSGSTGVASVNLDRKFIGIELEEKYFEIAKKRIAEADAVLVKSV